MYYDVGARSAPSLLFDLIVIQDGVALIASLSLEFSSMGKLLVVVEACSQEGEG